MVIDSGRAHVSFHIEKIQDMQVTHFYITKRKRARQRQRD